MGFLRYLLLLLTLLAFIPSQAQNEDYEYERSSLCSMMIKHLNNKYGDIIEEMYLGTPLPERFNDHNLGVKLISFAESEGDQRKNIEVFINKVNLGQKMVSKWFDRDKKTGSFDMELIKSRGFYNASQSMHSLARADIRGIALLEDAGELLIKNTYLIVNDIAYQSKTGAGVWVKTFASVYTGGLAGNLDEIYKIGGFSVEITSYLFKLDWDDDKANIFYTNYYTEDGSKELDKVEAFMNERELFSMTYVGQTFSRSSETKFSSTKDPKKLLIKVCTRTLDKNIAQLQHEHPFFRIKAPLISVDPLSAHVGLKEDITEDSRFEVLERVIDKDGKLSYKHVGVIKPEKGKIWDNRYMAEEDEGEDSNLHYTTFRKVSGGDFYPGMLIRETE